MLDQGDGDSVWLFKPVSGPGSLPTSIQRAFKMSGIDFSEAIRAEYDQEGIIKVLFTLCRAYCREEVDDTAMDPLFMLAFNRNYLFQQSLSRQKGTKTQKEGGAIRHAAWQKEANKVSTTIPHGIKAMLQTRFA